MKRKRIQLFIIDEVMHDRRVINILSKIYDLSKREVEKIYYKMERKVKETKLYIKFIYPRLATI